jgi:aspartyl-tRNA(Asn)/glutamyl-tRNA(Gln) amidotransferase subunit A
VRGPVEAALAALAGNGAEIREARIAGIEQAPAAQFMTICAEATQEHWGLLVERGERLGPDVRVRLEIGQFLQSVDYVKAQRLRRALRDAMLAALGDADAIVSPTLGVPVPDWEAKTINIDGQEIAVHPAVTRLTLPFNLTGLPAISLPCGRDRNGLPVGLQLAGRPGSEAALLRLARLCERLIAATP